MRKDNVTGIRLLDNIREVGLFHHLQAIRRYGLEAKPTDLAVITGGARDKYGYTPYWTSTTGTRAQAVIVSELYTRDKHTQADKDAKTPCIRPVLEIKKVPNRRSIRFGEYPQTVETNENIIKELNTFQNPNVQPTGRDFWIDNNYQVSEYEYNGQKYVAVRSKNNRHDLLHDGTPVEDGKLYWVKVEPLTWYVSNDGKLLICVDAILSGVRFWYDLNETDVNKSNMYDFLNNKMLKDIKNFEEIVQEDEEDLETSMKKAVLDKFAIFKNYLENRELCRNEELTVQEFLRQKNAFDEINDDRLRETLYEVLYNEVLDFDNIHDPHFSAASSIDGSFKDIIFLLARGMDIKKETWGQKHPEIDLSPIKKFLKALEERVTKLTEKDGEFLLESGNNGNRYPIYRYLYGIIDLIIEPSEEVVKDMLSNYIIYNNKYHDLLISLDVQLGEYDYIYGEKSNRYSSHLK